MSGSTGRTVAVERGALVSPEARISGTVRVGKGTIVHPKAVILAEGGPIDIGDFNIIEENVILINKGSESKASEKMVIGKFNHFEVGCEVVSSNIGNCNTMEVQSVVSEGCIVRDGCVIGTRVRLTPFQTVNDNTVVYGPQSECKIVKDQREAHLALHKRHLELQQRAMVPSPKKK